LTDVSGQLHDLTTLPPGKELLLSTVSYSLENTLAHINSSDLNYLPMNKLITTIRLLYTRSKTPTIHYIQWHGSIHSESYWNSLKKTIQLFKSSALNRQIKLFAILFWGQISD